MISRWRIPIMAVQSDDKPVEDSDNGGAKRSREEAEGVEQKEEERAKTEDEKTGDVKSAGNGEVTVEPVTVGPKTFSSSVEIFYYFYKLLHSWTPNIDLKGLLKKGHAESERKISTGIKAFQVRFHPEFKSRCFFLTREDESVVDFSFRKCVDHILPLPENMQIKHDVNKALRGKGHGRGRGRGGK